MALSIPHLVIFAIALVGIFALFRFRKSAPNQAAVSNRRPSSSQPPDLNKSEEYRSLDKETPDGGPNVAAPVMDQMLQHAMEAANAACEVVSGLLPVLDDGAIMAEFSAIEKKMDLMIARGPRGEIEPLLGRALNATSQLGSGAQWLEFKVAPTDSRKGLFVHTLFAIPNGKKAAIPTVLWRSNDLLYLGFQQKVADKTLKATN